MDGLFDFFTAFGLNFVTALVIVRGIYYPIHRSKKYVFTFLAFNAIIFFVLSMMTSVDISIGVGFGLFAIFSVLRYRTNPIPIREMTYLFIIAALPVMNATAAIGDYWLQLVIANACVIAILFVLEKEWGFAFESSQTITYDKINLIRPENRTLLIEDLEGRTGLTIKKLEIGRINLLRDTAKIRIFYDERLQPEPLEMPQVTKQVAEKHNLLFTS